MKHEIFGKMQAQMTPGAEVLDALRARTAEKRRVNWTGWAVGLAACAAVALAVWVPLRGQLDPPLHSYQVTAGAEGPKVEYTQGKEDADHGVGGGVSTGEIVEADAAAQEEANAAYQTLMAYFLKEYGPGGYPDWYGGAYLDDVLGDILIVAVTEPQEDKSLYLQIQEWAQSTRVGFTDATYSMSELLELQKQVEALPQLREMGSWSCGVMERDNCLELRVGTADQDLLAALHRLDPKGDAIRVLCGQTYETEVKTAPLEELVAPLETPQENVQAPQEPQTEDAAYFEDLPEPVE